MELRTTNEEQNMNKSSSRIYGLLLSIVYFKLVYIQPEEIPTEVKRKFDAIEIERALSHSLLNSIFSQASCCNFSTFVELMNGESKGIFVI